ncbi:hypothetical protein SALBM311S_12684 [Streptomyces alboniger]
MRGGKRLAAVDGDVGDPAGEESRADIGEQVARVVQVEPGGNVVRQRGGVFQRGQGARLVPEGPLAEPAVTSRRTWGSGAGDQRVQGDDAAEAVADEDDGRLSPATRVRRSARTASPRLR